MEYIRGSMIALNEDFNQSAKSISEFRLTMEKAPSNMFLQILFIAAEEIQIRS